MRVASLVTPVTLIIRAFKKFRDDDCLNLSSSISFVFILSIIPFAMLNICIFSMIQRVALPELSLTEYLGDVLAREMVRFIPLITVEWVKTYIVFPTSSFSSFGLFNILLLPVVSGLLFKTLETACRKIFRLPGRHLLLGQALYAALAVFVALSFFVFSFLWSFVSTAAAQAINFINRTGYFTGINASIATHPILSKINFFSAFLIIAFFFLTVKIFLNVKIKFLHTALAALIFCLLWIIAREIFQIYVEYVSKVNLVYGSISSIIIILLWIFYSSLTLLFSVEILYFLHTKKV